MSRVTTILMLSAIVVFVAGTVQAEVITDNFFIDVGYDGNKINGGGNGEGWVEQGSWWTQWFYDHPLDMNRWKKITVNADIWALHEGAPPTQEGSVVVGHAEVAINWSNHLWDDENTPPTDEQFIERKIIWDGDIEVYWFEDPDFGWMAFPEQCSVVGEAVILDYNPVWVSIDVKGDNFDFMGTIEHECIPEPGTMCLLALGGIGVLIKRRRK